MNLLPDKEAFVQLIQQNRKIIYKICNSYCANRDKRDDLAQEIVYNLWKSYNSFKPAFKFSTWMYRIALNVAISFYRNENKSGSYTSLDEKLIVYDEDTGLNTDKESNLKLLMQFINELKEIDRSVMLLYLDDKGYKEISEITGITESNVATKINRIKDKLRTNFSTVKN